MSGGWNTIESDAGVFTALLEGLGVSEVQFDELFALDPDYLKQIRQVTCPPMYNPWYTDGKNKALCTG